MDGPQPGVVQPNPEAPCTIGLDHYRNPAGQAKVVLRLHFLNGMVMTALDSQMARQVGEALQEHAKQADTVLQVADASALSVLRQNGRP